MNIGVIMEANPFHLGHQYLFDQIKERFDPDCLTVITTTSFNMRGDISPINKFNKTKYILQAGANIVIELPTFYAVQSADIFGYYAVKSLNELNVTDIVCGCETDDIYDLITLIEETETIEYQSTLRTLLKEQKLSYKVACSKALEALNVDEELIKLFNSPNATLAISYLKAINIINPYINLRLIKRYKTEYDSLEETDNIASATSLRMKLLNNENINNFIPFEQEFINLKSANEKYFELIKYQLLLNYDKISYNSEGIINYIIKNATWNKDYETFINSLSNKKYTKSRIKRTILHSLINQNIDFNQKETYLRLLGFDKIGIEYISNLPKENKNNIFSSVKELNNEFNTPILNYELKTTKLFDIISNSETYIKEYQLPIRKEQL